MDDVIAALAREQHGLITLAQLDEIGITRRQRQWRPALRTMGVAIHGCLPDRWHPAVVAQ